MNGSKENSIESAECGLFGKWTTDIDGLPAYDYTAMTDIPASNAAAIDHWHQVGNDLYTAEAHAGGWVVPYRWERGMTRLAGRDMTEPAGLAGVGALIGGGKDTPLLRHLIHSGWKWRVRWGVGYAAWTIESENISILKKVSAPFGDDPVILIDIEIDVKSGDWVYEERWPIIPYSVGLPLPMTHFSPAPKGIVGKDRIAWRVITAVSGSLRKAGDIPRRFQSKMLKWDIKKQHGVAVGIASYKNILLAPNPDKKSFFENDPRPVFMGTLEGAAQTDAKTIDGGIMLSSRTEKLSTGVNKFRLIFGWCKEPEISSLIEKYKKPAKNLWGKHLPLLSSGENESLDREISWHGGYLRGMMIKDDYFENHIIPQGSAYSYLHGAHGAIRDYVFSAVPLTYLAPERAREFIIAIARMTVPTGEMIYSHVGFGQSTGAGGLHAAPTDLALFFLWAVVEYVAATRDVSILDERAPFYPKEAGKSSTIRERVAIAWRYMRDRVGVGPHDLLRAGTGDWNDPISYMVENPGVFHKRGESCYNTAMALWVLPKAAKLIETWSARDAAEILKFSKSLEKPMLESWTGDWYLRGWDGLNNPIGENRLFLESNVWCLISGIGGAERMKILVKNIAEKLDNPSPIGANILDKPVKIKHGFLAPGWDCNGGVWAALNGLLCWGYSLYDPELAWRSLEKQSLASHERAYPHIWYGIWSGPDAYNAHWAHEPGHTFIHPLTPMREYPLMNSNTHALPLLAVLKIAGVEPSALNLEITPRIPKRIDPWKIDFPLLTVEMRNGIMKYKINK